MILKVDRLYKSFFENNTTYEILKGANLVVEKNETIAVTGESGSGKSTLLYLVGLLDNPDSGTITFYKDNQVLKIKNSQNFRNNNLGFVFQFHYLLSDFNLEENVAMPMFIKTKNYTKSIKHARELLKRVGIFDRREFYSNQISGGEQQRAAIARAVINNPDVLLADEPTGNLDEKHADNVLSLLMELNKEIAQTIIMVTHNKEIASKMQTHYELKNGILEKV